MEFVSLGAYQFGKSLSKMVPLIDLDSRTTIQFFVRFHSRKSWSMSQKMSKRYNIFITLNGQEQKLTATRSFLGECLSFRYTQLPWMFFGQIGCWLSVISDLLTIDLWSVKKLWRLSLIFDTLPVTFMGFSFVGGKRQKYSANLSKFTFNETDGGHMHNISFRLSV